MRGWIGAGFMIRTTPAGTFTGMSLPYADY
jgi:hypothetical protein